MVDSYPQIPFTMAIAAIAAVSDLKIFSPRLIGAKPKSKSFRSSSSEKSPSGPIIIATCHLGDGMSLMAWAVDPREQLRSFSGKDSFSVEINS